MKLSDKICFAEYHEKIGNQIKNRIEDFSFQNSEVDFGYQTQVSAVFSSNIEGNSIDLNSFMNYKLSQQKFKPGKELKEIEDLINAYEFAQNNLLNEKNFLKTHHILSEELLIKSLRGNYRNDKVGVFGTEGLVYLAIEPEFLKETMHLFFEEINELLSKDISTEEVFYYASIIHLRFVHIHPFRDGNGRSARLLEKWFLTKKLGKEFWKLNSEKYYKEHQSEYYKNISIGFDYYALDYSKALPFLEMLPKSLEK